MKIIGYVGDGTLPEVTASDAKILDVINIAFGLVGSDGTLDSHQITHLEELPRIRESNPEIKIVLSVGGWGAGGFSLMSRTQEGRERFAESCAAYVEKNGLDGIDIDWEYPCSDLAEIDYDPSDKQNYTLLLEALRSKLGSNKTVSVAVGAGDYFVRDTEMDKVGAVCDYVQLMTYDMRSGFCSEAGHHTALYSSGRDDKLDTESVVNMFMAAGVPKSKLIIGAAFYSRKWEGVPDINHGLFQPASTIGQYGAGYSELKESYIDKNGYTRYWDDTAKAPYLFNGSTLISYDDAESIACKCDYILREGIPGIMYWEHRCDSSRELLNTMAEKLKNG